MSISQPKSMARRHFDIGYSLYLHMQPLEACQNDDQRQGWLSANRAEAECNTIGYAASQGWWDATILPVILVVSDERAASIPADFLAAIEDCEKAYHQGTWYVALDPTESDDLADYMADVEFWRHGC